MTKIDQNDIRNSTTLNDQNHENDQTAQKQQIQIERNMTKNYEKPEIEARSTKCDQI